MDERHRPWADVVLVEARRVGAGASGYNTGKVTALTGLVYDVPHRRDRS